MRTIIGIEAAEKQIDAGIPVMHDDTKDLPSRSIDERSGLKGMRHDRTGETGSTFSSLSDPTCFTARGKEFDVGPDAFQADSMSMADEAMSFTAWERGIALEGTCLSSSTNLLFGVNHPIRRRGCSVGPSARPFRLLAHGR